MSLSEIWDRAASIKAEDLFVSVTLTSDRPPTSITQGQETWLAWVKGTGRPHEWEVGMWRPILQGMKLEAASTIYEISANLPANKWVTLSTFGSPEPPLG